MSAVVMVAYFAPRTVNHEPFEIRSRHTLMLYNPPVPQAGDHDIITIVLENRNTFAIQNISVFADIVTSVDPPVPSVAISVLCPPTFTSGLIQTMLPKAKVMCKALYMITTNDIEQLATITAVVSAHDVTVASSISLEDNVFVIASHAAISDDEFGFVHGNCNNTEPSLACDTSHMKWTYLCVEHQTLYSCNATGWNAFFILAISDVNMQGNPYSMTTASFVQPACDGNVMVTVESTAWMASGQIVFVEGGGYYIVASITDSMMATLINPCFAVNSVTGTVIGSTPAAVVPAGQEGPSGGTGPAGSTGGTGSEGSTGGTGSAGVSGGTGPEGPSGGTGPGGSSTGSVLSLTTQDYIQPDCDGSVVVNVDSTDWMSPGLIVHVASGGYYVIGSVIDSTSISLMNPCTTGNTENGTTVNSTSMILPAGAPGPSGGTGPAGPTGAAGDTTVTDPPFAGVVDYVATGNVLSYSIDGGNSFTAISTAFFTFSYDVAYSLPLGIWIAVGSGSNTAVYSTNGVQWFTSPLGILFSQGNAIAWSDTANVWVAGGQGSTRIATSPDGSTWTARPSPFTSAVYGVAYAKERARWVAVGQGAAAIAYSSDNGVTWVQAMAQVSGIVGKHVTWAPEIGTFLVSLSGAASAYVSTTVSGDGIAWALDAKAFQPEAVVTGSAWNGTHFYLTGITANNTIISSTNGRDFVDMGKSELTASGLGVCWGVDFDRWVVLGTGGNGPIFTQSNVNGSMTLFPGGYILGTRCAAKYTIAESNVTVSPGPAVNAKFMAVGQGESSIAYQLAGERFYTPVGLQHITGNGNDVAYSLALNMWIAVGSGVNRGAASTNGGVSWAVLPSLNSAISSGGFAICWSDEQARWVAGGSGTNKIATSTDGITWTGQLSPFTTQVNGIAYSQQRDQWVAVGSGGAAVAYSNDGMTWTQAVGVVSNVVGSHVTWSFELQLFLATFSGGSTVPLSTATSTDGISWSMAQDAFQTNSTFMAVSVTGSAWNGTQFIVSGTTTIDTLQTSTNGITFSGLGKTDISNSGLGVCYGADYSVWTFVGTGTNVISSRSSLDDAVVGFSRPFSAQANRCFARYSSARTVTLSSGPVKTVDFVIVGQGGSSLGYRLTGDRYFTPMGLALFSTSGGDVAYSPSLNTWIAVGTGVNRGVISTTGYSWTRIPSLAAALSTSGLAIARSDAQDLWVAGGAGTFRIATSSDGTTWNNQTSPFTTQVNGIAFSPERNRWVAVGSGTAAIAYSSDGITWTQAMAVVASGVGRHVTWSSELGLFLVSMSGGPAGYPSVVTSVNGIAWSVSSDAFAPSTTTTGAAWNGTMFMLTGASAVDTIQSSTDGLVFTGLGKSDIPTSGNGVCHSSLVNEWLFLGTSAINNVYSLSTANGTKQFSSPFSTLGSRCVARSSSSLFTLSPGPNVTVSFVAVGQGDASLAYSITEGRTFTPLSQLFTVGSDVTYSPAQDKWIAVGSGTNRGMSSTNGLAWTPIPSLASAISTAGLAIVWSDVQSQWVAGGSGTNKIATSPDGVTWTARASPFATQVTGLAYSPEKNRWVAVGSGTHTICYSADNAMTWMPLVAFSASVSGRSVLWSSQLGMFIATMGGGASGANSIMTSVNGIAWIVDSTAFQPNALATGIAWNGTQFMLTGTSTTDTIQSTVDGVSFTSQGMTGLTTSGQGLCYGVDYNTWVFVGSGTSMTFTQSALNGTTLGRSNPFLTQGNRCAAKNFNVTPSYVSTPDPIILADFVVTGNGGAHVAYSINGGRTFTPVVVNNLGTSAGVAYSRTQQQWFACGSSGTAASGDGILWIANAFPFGAAIARSDEQNLWLITWSSGGGSPERISGSTNTVSWFTVAQVNGANNGIIIGMPQAIMYSRERNMWIACDGGRLAGSYNGLNWFVIFTPTSSTTPRHVNFMPELGIFFASLGGGGLGTGTTATSYDGVAWAVELNAFQSGAVAASSAAWNGTMMYVTGSSATENLLSSTNGINFVSHGFQFLTGAANSVCYGDEYQRWIFAGSGSSTIVTQSTVDGSITRTNPFSSSAGRCAARFTVVPTPVVPPIPAYMSDFVVVGSGTASIAYSLTQGRTFVPTTKESFATSGNDVAFSASQNKWIAVGTGSQGGMSSSNGVSWVNLASLTSVAGGAVLGIARSESQNLWVAVGAGTNRIATSSDGVTWTGRPSPFTNRANGVVYSKTLGLWVAAGAGTAALASSPDGITWTQRFPDVSGTAGQHVLWAEELGIFFASLSGGPNGVSQSAATSADGITWNTTALVFQPSASTLGAAWDGTTMWLAGFSSLNTLATSSNGLTFTGSGNTLFTSIGKGACYGAEYNRWQLLGGSTNSGYTYSTAGGPAIVHRHFSGTANRCTARYVNATT